MIEVTANFGREDNLASVSFQDLAEKFFAVSVSVDVRRVVEVASELKSPFNRCHRDFVVCWSVAVPVVVSPYCPGPETNLADFDTCLSKGPVFHYGTLSKDYEFRVTDLQKMNLA